jgi:hypothetical protein
LSSQNAYPISFAIPANKISKDTFSKRRLLAINLPGIKSTYIYNDEESYYAGYRESYFGLTHKKNGWDCMRHYEIIANNCLPYFPDVNEIPVMTMHNFPKELVLECNDLYLNFDEVNDLEKWSLLQSKLLNHLLKFNTDIALANYIIAKFRELS